MSYPQMDPGAMGGPGGGGDPDQDAGDDFMQQCVAQVMQEQGHSQADATRLCRAAMAKMQAQGGGAGGGGVPQGPGGY
jgi:hypothetical protein